jgi:GTP:adenosylcobinamide-phosphate guanylyltransferase
MDAIVIAGGIPGPDEPLYPYTQGKPKALLDLCGKPMIQWVIDALEKAALIDRIVIVGLSEGNGISGGKIHSFIPNQGGMLNNIRTGVRSILASNPNARHVIIASSDIPGVTPEKVDWMVNTAMQTDDDVYYYVVSRQVMESRYPSSKRSYVRLKDVEVCGGDMNVIRSVLVEGNDELWERIVDARKNAFKQAALLGYDTLLMLLFRMITLEGAARKVSKRIKLHGRVLLCPYAEIAMDVDKPHQFEIMRADLAGRGIS